MTPDLSGPLLDRPRLLDRLDELSTRMLTLVVGPAGAGKTTLLAQWLERREEPIVDVPVDPGPVRPVVETLLGRTGRASEIDRVLASDSIGDAIVELFTRGGIAERPVRIAFDFGPTAVTGPAAELLDRLANADPSIVRLVVATRALPDLALGHLLTGGQVGTVSADDLAFTTDEIGAVARLRLGRALDPDELAELHGRSRGWVVAVLAALVSASGTRGNPGRVSPDDASSTLDAFIFDQIVDRLSGSQREFLFEAVELENIQPSACDAIFGRDDSAMLLAELDHQLSFLTRTDPAQGMHVFDPEFRAAVRRRNRRDRPALATRIARAAADHHAARGDRLAAAANLIELQRYDEAIDQLAVFARTAVGAHDMRRLRGLVDRVPPAAYRSHPTGLQTLASLLLIVRDQAGALAILDELDASVDERSPLWWSTRTFVLGARTARGMWALDPGGTVADAEAALAMFDDVPDGVPTGLDDPPFDWSRALVFAHGAAAQFRLDRFDEARRWAASARRLGGELANIRARMLALDALVAATVGDLDTASELASRAEVAARERPGRHSIAVDAEMARAIVALERSRLDDAGRSLDRLGGMEEFPYPVGISARIAVLHARLHLARGELRSGLMVCDRLRRATPEGVPFDVRGMLTTVEVRLALRYEQAGHARRLTEGSPPSRESYASTALLYWLERDHRALATHLGSWPVSPCAVNRIEYLIFRALQAEHAKRPEARHAFLMAATRAADAPGLIRVFLDTAPGVVDLLRTDVARTHDPDPTMLSVLQRLGASVPRAGERPGPVFSPREQSIVELLPTHLTGVEIAASLGISTSTLKSHQKRIYRKLEVRRRADAVDRLLATGAVDVSIRGRDPV